MINVKIIMNEAIKYKYVETTETEKEIFLDLTKKVEDSLNYMNMK